MAMPGFFNTDKIVYSSRFKKNVRKKYGHLAAK